MEEEHYPFDTLTQEALDLYHSTTIERIPPPTPLEFYRDYVSKNKPVIITGAIDHWPALNKWTDQYLVEKMGDENVTVAFTPDGYGDAPSGEYFVTPMEEQISFREFVNILHNPSQRNGVPYLQKQNGSFHLEFTKLLPDIMPDIPFATAAFGSEPSLVNFWMGDGRVVSSLHHDPYENMYAVIAGEKMFTLVPPTDYYWLGQKNFKLSKWKEQKDGSFEIEPDETGTTVPWFPDDIDKSAASHSDNSLIQHATPMRVVVRTGELLYLPSLFYHQVSQRPDQASERIIAVNFWYEMDFDIKYAYFRFMEKVANSRHKQLSSTSSSSPSSSQSPEQKKIESETHVDQDPSTNLDLYDPIRKALSKGIKTVAPGISVSLSFPQDIKEQKVHTFSVGFRDICKKASINDNDVFCIGSITKTFVAVIVLQLVQERLISLDDCAANYILPSSQHNKEAQHSQLLHLLNDIPNATTATVRQLLNHTSKIPSWEFHPTWMRKARGSSIQLGHTWHPIECLKYCTFHQIGLAKDLENDTAGRSFDMDELKRNWPSPGSSFSYSNTNYTLLGLLIERITGNTLVKEIESRICSPLNLTESFLYPQESSRECSRITNHYHYLTDSFQQMCGIHPSFKRVAPANGATYGTLLDTSPASASLSAEWAAGGLCINSNGLCKFALALRDGTLLNPEMQVQMIEFCSSPSYSSYGLGIKKFPSSFVKALTGDDDSDHLVGLGHAGGTLGYSAFMFYLDDTRFSHGSGGSDSAHPLHGVVITCLMNVGGMHTKLAPDPFSKFLLGTLLPSIAQVVQSRQNQLSHSGV